MARSSCVHGPSLTGSTFGAAGPYFRNVCLPVSINLLTLLIEVTVGGEFFIIYRRRGRHVVRAGIEHEQAHARGYLEVRPGHRYVFFTNSENAAPCDYQISDLAGRRTHHDVVDAAEGFVLRVAHFDADQLVGSEWGIPFSDRLCSGDLLLPPLRHVRHRYAPGVHVGDIDFVDVAGRREHVFARL